MKILVPSASMAIKPGTTIPEVDAAFGEVAWTETGTYAVDDLRVYGGGVYSCVLAHTATATGPRPSKDTQRWLFKQPTNRMRPFDEYMYTKASSPGELKYMLQVPFASGFAMHGVEAGSFHFVYRDAPVGGADGVALIDVEKSTLEQARGLYQLLFRRSSLQRMTKWTSPRLPLRPSATVEITLTNSGLAGEVAVGWIGLGHWHEIKAPQRDIGATEQGVEWTPRTTARRKDRGDGTYIRTKGLRSKVTSGTAIFDASEAPRIAALMEECLDSVVAVDFSDLPKYAHLSGVGFLTGRVVHEGFTHCRLNFTFDSNV